MPSCNAEQFIGAFDRLGARWGAISASSDIDLLKFQNDIEDFLSPMILASGRQKHRDSAPGSFDRARPRARHASLCRAMDREDFDELIVRLPDFSVALGTWQELFRLVAELHSEKYQDIAHHSSR